MITRFDKYIKENYFVYDFEYEDIDIQEFIKGKRKSDIENIIKDKFKGKYVSFTTRRDSDTITTHNDFVDDIKYEIRTKIVKIKLRDTKYYLILFDDKITINVTKSNADKYNL